MLVTGGGRGIGRSIAPGFAEAGADVVVSSRNKRPPELDRVVEQIRDFGRKMLGISVHVGKRQDVQGTGSEDRGGIWPD